MEISLFFNKEFLLKSSDLLNKYLLLISYNYEIKCLTDNHFFSRKFYLYLNYFYIYKKSIIILLYNDF